MNLGDKSVSRKHAIISCTDKSVWLEDLNSRFGIRINGEPMKEAKSELILGDSIVFGVAETESISIGSFDARIFCMPDVVHKPLLTKYDVYYADVVDMSTTHVLSRSFEDPLSKCLALVHRLKLVTGDYLNGFTDSDMPTEPAPLYDDRNRSALLKGYNVLDLGVHHLLKMIIEKCGGAIIDIDCVNDACFCLDQAVAYCSSIDAKSLLTAILNCSTEALVINQKCLTPSVNVDVPSQTDRTKGIAQIHKFHDDEVKVVVSYDDLKRKVSANTIGAPIASGNNVKRFKKSHSVRPKVDCIGLADMKPYRSIMETGVNSSKLEVWLDDDKYRIEKPLKRIVAPNDDNIADTLASEGRFRSSFFAEGLSFD